MRIDNYEAWIECDGRKLEELSIEKSNKGLGMTCWISGETGKAITVVVKDHNQVSATSWKLIMDGIVISRKPLSLGKTVGKKSKFVNHEGLECPILFSEPEYSYEEEPPNDQKGTIKIVVRRVITTGSSPRDNSNRQTLRPIKVTTKREMFDTNCLSMGDPTGKASSTMTDMRYVDKDPGVTFLFRYRKQAAAPRPQGLIYHCREALKLMAKTLVNKILFRSNKY